jgi:hypothetical protein
MLLLIAGDGGGGSGDNDIMSSHLLVRAVGCC